MFYSFEDKKKLLANSIRYIYNHHLLSFHSFCFTPDDEVNSAREYDKFKEIVADQLGVHKQNICIFGSAKLGFSLNPYNNLSDFTEDSDIDIAVVSDTLFKHFSQEYLEAFYSQKYKYYKHKYVSSSMFKQMIVFDGFEETYPAYSDWTQKTAGFQTKIQLDFCLTQDINYRIFKSWDAVELYYSDSISKCKEKLL